MTILELAHQTGINPKWAANTGGGEYHSSCPVCGGTDRFYIQPYRQMGKCLGSYCCRQCGINGDAIQFAREFLNYSFQEAVQAVNAIMPERVTLPPFSISYRSRPATLQKPPIEWIERATEFVAQAHENILLKKDILEYLATRGLPLEATLRYKFGWSDKNEFLSRNNWGLNEQLSNDSNQRPLWIPKGLVIPIIESNRKVIRLKIRRFDWKHGDKLPKYVAISGSMNGLSLIGSSKHKIMVVVESELDAYAIDYVAHDFVCTIAVGSNIKNPDNLIDRLAGNVKHLLICYDQDDAGRKMFDKWLKFYPHARACLVPYGKDVGEYITLGGNIRTLISGISDFNHN